MKKIVLASALAFLASCASQNTTTPSSFDWKGANVYFAVTDRFNNGNPDNDVNFNRTEKAAVLRGFEGGDIRGVIQKIDEGYFNKLGINAIWLTPIVEQITALQTKEQVLLMLIMDIGLKIGPLLTQTLERKKI